MLSMQRRGDSDYFDENTSAVERRGRSDHGETEMPKPNVDHPARKSRALGVGYRRHIRELRAAGASETDILRMMPGLRPSELALTLALGGKRGRPPKPPTVASVAAVRRWRATKRPRTLRAALECIDFLLGMLDREEAGTSRPARMLVV
jgi:hypothetical protein